jgi:ATP-dependent HslUV protease ATP-binding subunit HslU
LTIHLPERSEELVGGDPLTPRQVVAELDRYVVGQQAAKRAVAIALRNRIRRQKLPPEVAVEITPKNILMIGPTGVGKTEIARRLAQLSASPFLKVEASKFTEVGYVGRDVESMVRDLTESAADLVRREKQDAVREKAQRNVEERLLDLLLPGSAEAGPEATLRTTREKLREQLREGRLEERTVEVELQDGAGPSFQILSGQGVQEMGVQVRDMLPGLFGTRTRKRRLSVGEAREALGVEEASRLVDETQVSREAVERVESSGILFIDEIDKIAGPKAAQAGPDVSREGVQRDLLPIVEGTTVVTKHGPVRTDHVLFIAAGAFHVSKPQDLIPELQGRFPIRVELQALSRADLVRILTEPRNALTGQYRALLATEGIELSFSDEAVEELARVAEEVNVATENIGARRLATVMEALLDEISFEADGSAPRAVHIGRDEVRARLGPLVQSQDLRRFIL